MPVKMEERLRRRLLLLGAALLLAIGMVGAQLGTPEPAGAKKGYGGGGYGGGGYKPCEQQCQVRKCKKQCKKVKRTCVFCGRADKKAAAASCKQSATQSLGSCAGDRTCKSGVKSTLKACRNDAKGRYQAAKAQCAGLTGTCSTCCQDSGSRCGGTFRGTNGYGTFFYKVQRYGKTKTYRPDCALRESRPGSPKCLQSCDQIRQGGLSGCAKQPECIASVEGSYQACLAQCAGSTITTTTTTTTLPQGSCEIAGWGCCKLSSSDGTCAREYGGSEQELTNSQAYCAISGGAWSAGRCPDPLCGAPIGCCLSSSLIRQACEEGSFGTSSTPPPFCGPPSAAFVPGRCVEPPDPCPPGSPADCCRRQADCDDGLVCNGMETCEQNRCKPGTPVNCSFGDQCTAYHCQEPGLFCVPDDISPKCDDGDACNGFETPDCVTGECRPGTPVDCDQSDDHCYDFRCQSTNNFASCVYDTLPQPTCDDGNGCNGFETFSCATGQCVQSPPYDCDQYDDFCTDYSCASFGGSPTCLSTALPQQDCDDGDACDGYESYDCAVGSCKSGPAVFCPPGQHCESTSNSPACVAD